MEKLKQIAEWFQNFGITLYQVGGSVRDEIMGLPVEDVDICVVDGGSAFQVENKLSTLVFFKHITRITPVHGSFPIWIVEIEGEKYEFAMARKEKKVGQSRQEFECEVNNVSIEEDLMRRDLTINAIAKNIVTGEIVDPYHGRIHIKIRMAAPVSKAFMEDPLRVYRAARFMAKFDLLPNEELCFYCKSVDLNTISNERVGMELMKMFKTAKKPSAFFNFLAVNNLLHFHFPELDALIGVPQDPLHHPEGDAFTHTMHCIDAAQGWFYRAVMLCHDLGKANTTQIDGLAFSNQAIIGLNKLVSPDFGEHKITAHGHEEAGVEPTKAMLKRIHFANHDTIDQIACLVELHMIRIVMNKDNHEKILRRTIRKLRKYDLKYWQLCITIFYDLQGRPPKPFPSESELFVEQLYALRAYTLEDSEEMKPIVTGEKLLARGMLPGPEMGKIISHALQLQDRGTLTKQNWTKVLHGAGYKI